MLQLSHNIRTEPVERQVPPGVLTGVSQANRMAVETGQPESRRRNEAEMIITSPPAIRARESAADRSPGARRAAVSEVDEEKSGISMVSFGPTGVQSTLMAGALKKSAIKTDSIIK